MSFQKIILPCLVCYLPKIFHINSFIEKRKIISIPDLSFQNRPIRVQPKPVLTISDIYSNRNQNYTYPTFPIKRFFFDIRNVKQEYDPIRKFR